MSKKKISRTAYREGRELFQRLRVRFPLLFPDDRRDLKPWAIGEDARMRQALADAEDGETVSTEVWRAAVGHWFNGDLKRRGVYLKCLTAGAPRYDIHGNMSGTVSEEEAAHATVKLVERQAQLAELRAGVKAKKGPEAAAAVKCGDEGQGKGDTIGVLCADSESPRPAWWARQGVCFFPRSHQAATNFPEAYPLSYMKIPPKARTVIALPSFTNGQRIPPPDSLIIPLIGKET